MWCAARYAEGMQSKATSVEAYLKELPEDRRAAISAVREVILKNLDKGYQEGMGYGMIGYSVPHSIFPSGYHCDPKQPLPFAGLASQKQHMSVYLMGLYYGDGGIAGESSVALLKWFLDAWKKTGKKLDMGKCCIRFRKLEDLPLEVIGEAVRRVPVQACIDTYVQALRSMGKGLDGKPLKEGASARGAVKSPARRSGPPKSAAKKGGAKAPARRAGLPKGAAGKKVAKKKPARKPR